MMQLRDRERLRGLSNLILASIGDGVVVTDTGGRITYLNAAAGRLLNIDPASALHSPLSSAFDLRRVATEEHTEAIELLNLEGEAVSIDLRAVPLQAGQGSPGGTVYTLRDPVERRRAEEVERRMAALVDSAEDAIITKSLDGIVRSWNAGAETLLEFRADEIVGESITRLIPKDRQDEETIILDRIRQGQRVAHFETVRRKKSGVLVDVSLTISPIRDRTGAVIGASKIMRDITERKQHVEQLRKLNVELQASIQARTAELKERDVMLQEIHHRVKNNLQVISSLISLQVRTLHDDDTRSALQQCQSRVLTMAQIHELLYQSTDYARVPFGRYAQELVARVLGGAVGPSESVSVRYELSEVWLAVDKAIPCGLILNELVSNAVKHAFPSKAGTICVELRPLPDDRVLLAVSDDGIGIAEDYAPCQSRSLGIQLVVMLTAQLGGSLDIRRRPGAAFRVTFPAREPA